ncbi:hypothetical protein LAT59_02010 [Candidatus Gracilibacteria bacterium]|nr:hypothetical protein [Candidatus Gracilibacteria bacterium]
MTEIYGGPEGKALPSSHIGWYSTLDINASKIGAPCLQPVGKEIALACGDLARRCGNCLNRNSEGRCEAPGNRSGIICSDTSLPCLLHDFDSEVGYIK